MKIKIMIDRYMGEDKAVLIVSPKTAYNIAVSVSEDKLHKPDFKNNDYCFAEYNSTAPDVHANLEEIVEIIKKYENKKL